MVEKYISDNQDVHTTINIDNSYFEDGGFFIFFEENNLISEEINYLELENEFKNENIEFKRISLKSKQYECGCGAIFVSILYFIASTFVSGILWDGVKKGVCKVKTMFELLDGKSFRKLRKNVSDLTGIEEKLLVVKKLYFFLCFLLIPLYYPFFVYYFFPFYHISYSVIIISKTFI